jgi:RimJ/RimL family protein N-acetyltransferase
MRKNKLIFIKGESVNLCVPDLDDNNGIHLWTEMINNQETSSLISQGYFPQTTCEQIKYIQSILSSRSRILLEIRATDTDNFLGIISLSEIDQINKRGQLSTVCPYKCETVKFGALQARALLTDHAFRKLGLQTIYSYQAYPENKRWAQASEVLGYFPTGFILESYLHEGRLTNKVIISLSAKRYWEYTSNRRSIWPGIQVVNNEFVRLKDQPSRADLLYTFLMRQYATGS